MVKKGAELVPASTRTKIDQYFALGLARLREAKVESVRRGRIGTARTRFREGFTTEPQFIQELQLLRVSDEELDLELAAGRLDYATDYLRDLIAAYRDAVRKGNLSIDGYRERLSQLGLVPERVMGYVLREVARVRPGELPSVIGPPGEIYLTDEGRVITDTIRRRRQKELMSRDEEIASLLELGMPVSYAEAIADNDDSRLAEREEIEPEKIIPAYETDDGRVKVDTIRRERRKKIITREKEITSLTALEMPDWFAEAIAANDDVRLAEKLGEES
ncbi:hypothetical protein ES708_13172 [subsurface metagenome]